MPVSSEADAPIEAADVSAPGAGNARTAVRERSRSRTIFRWLVTFVGAFIGLAAAIWWTTRTDAVDPDAGRRIAISSSGPSKSETPVAALVPPTEQQSKKVAPEQPEHPLDPALQMAREALARIDNEIHDYTAKVVMQEKVGEKLLPESEIFVKVRHDRKVSDDVTIPFSVYLRYDGPPRFKGREAIWVRGWHKDNLVAHETGLLNVMKVYLDPKGDLAMVASRYPIYDIGLRNLVEKLIERGEKEKMTDPANCVVTEEHGVDLNGRSCRVIRVRHPEKKPDLEFSLAEIFVDEELQIPIRYAGYGWGDKPGEDQLLEQYTYLDLKLNVGLTDEDFMADNEAYNYP
ncbi:MAG TPA: DUF1571 domain-containing protein [Pirellulaceae bacterium]|jgi:hypothetical protein|nr:DUF1571 domain-containing protein [Pirellulaceae bacterium]